MQDTSRRPRRRHSAAFKAEVLAACVQPGASVASVALARGINANLVHHGQDAQSGTTPYDPLQAVVYDLAESRAGQHARRFLAGWQGKLVCDDFAGYKALFAAGVTEVGCIAHARSKFHDLGVSYKIPLAEEALRFFRTLYEIERAALSLSAEDRQRLRVLQTRPVLDTVHRWMLLKRQ